MKGPTPQDLIAQWRARADGFPACTSLYGVVYRACADELEKALREHASNGAVQTNAILESMIAALNGEPVSDFMASFDPVRLALDVARRTKP